MVLCCQAIHESRVNREGFVKICEPRFPDLLSSGMLGKYLLLKEVSRSLHI